AAITLMSTNVDGIATSIQLMHEIWVSVVELFITVYLLERQIEPACFLVVIPTILTKRMCVASVSVIATNYITDGITIQKRVSSISSMLTQIKGLKMMGLTDYITKSIQDLRASELEVSKIFRAFIVKIVLIGMLYHTLHKSPRLI
ncbi:hypothetical protein BKA64DRAFT_581162, partial [Cadophora sp. MPI-SDFR-AT-0126]